MEFAPIETYWLDGRVLGSGTYGEVTQGQGNTAIKKMNIRESGMNSILREIACLRAVNGNHHTMSVIDVSFTPDDVYLIMPLADGSLRNLIESGHPLDIPVLGYQILDAVSYTNSLNILHRDIKPDNFLYFDTPGGPQLKLADYGLVRTTYCTIKGSMTNPVYSLWYRAPEILLDLPYQVTAETWAIACVLYEMATGQPLFYAENENQLLQKIFSTLGSPSPDSESDRLRWNMPYSIYYPPGDIDVEDPELHYLILEMLTYDPAQRPTPLEMLDRRYFIGDKTVQNLPCPDKNLDQQYKLPDSNRNLKKIIHYIWDVAWNEKLSRKVLYDSLTYFERYLHDHPTVSATTVARASLKLAADFQGQRYDSKLLTPDIIQMEWEMLKYFNFDLIVVSPYDLIRYYGKNNSITNGALGILKQTLSLDFRYQYYPREIAFFCLTEVGDDFEMDIFGKNIPQMKFEWNRYLDQQLSRY